MSDHIVLTTNEQMFHAYRSQILFKFTVPSWFLIVWKSDCDKALVYLSFYFLTDNGIVLKVITIYNQETESMEEVILEELQIFKVFLVKKIK